jgi:alpha-tubulin suppressor-like RCC1 family protein
MADCFGVKITRFFMLMSALLSVLTLFILSGCNGSDSHNHTLSGKVTLGGTRLSGVTITISGDASKVTTTNTNGEYEFSGLPEGIFTLTASLTGYNFVPRTKKAYIQGIEHANGFNFSAETQVKISAATDTIYLKSDGTVWAWGSNSNGQLGDGTTNDRTTPIQVSSLSDVIAIAAGSLHTVALRTDWNVWAWGSNSNGQIGDDSTTDRHSPVHVGLSDIVAITAGSLHTLALAKDGIVWSWGDNSNGQLGRSGTTQKTTPGQVNKLEDIVAIAGGFLHSIAVDIYGNVWTWGSNSNGQLGDGTTSGHTDPERISGTGAIMAIAAGTSHSVALKIDNTIWTWGSNSNGQLGNGTTTDSLIPIVQSSP